MGGVTVNMKYYKDKTGNVCAFELDGSQDDYIKPGMIAMTAAEVDAHLNPKPTAKEIANEYKIKRAQEYPPVGDQLDVLWKQLGQLRLSGKLDLIQDADDMLDEILAVKKKYKK